MNISKIFKAILLSLLVMGVSFGASAQKKGSKDEEYRVVIDKPNLKLYVYKIVPEGEDELEATYDVCVGTNYGQKQKRGDRKTPEGDFYVSQVQDASSWTHDFKDGKGVRKGAYGPWFFRLATPPHSGIGIHGTCFPERIGTRDSEGCIRLHNEDLVKLKKCVRVGTKVKILPDKPQANSKNAAQETAPLNKEK